MGSRPDRYTGGVARRVDGDTHQLLADPPDWLVELLGQRPDDVGGATTYDDTVHTIAKSRARHGVTRDLTGWGRRPWGAETNEFDRLAAHFRRRPPVARPVPSTEVAADARPRRRQAPAPTERDRGHPRHRTG